MTRVNLPHLRPPTKLRSVERYCILVADDDPSTADIFTMLFATDPLDILSAADGRAALHLWRELHPELLLLDVRMPVLDGFEVCRQVRAADTDIPILFISAHADADHLHCGYGLDADGYLVKPIVDYLPIRLHILALLRRVQHRRCRLRQMYAALRAQQQRIRSRDLHQVVTLLEHELGLSHKLAA
jgi:DNA-binding response OmpR family regulator